MSTTYAPTSWISGLARRLGVFVAALATVLATLLVGAGPAEAASIVPTASCNINDDNGVNELKLRGPKIWANNGTTQTVRYRSQLWKAENGYWTFKANGVWRSGSATPNTAWQDGPRTWSLNSYGEGSYLARVQVQYLSSGSWTGTENKWVAAYYRSYFVNGQWTYQGAYNQCFT